MQGSSYKREVLCVWSQLGDAALAEVSCSVLLWNAISIEQLSRGSGACLIPPAVDDLCEVLVVVRRCLSCLSCFFMFHCCLPHLCLCRSILSITSIIDQTRPALCSTIKIGLWCTSRDLDDTQHQDGKLISECTLSFYSVRFGKKCGVLQKLLTGKM